VKGTAVGNLKVSDPGDAFEHHATTVSSTVARSVPTAQRDCGCGAKSGACSCGSGGTTGDNAADEPATLQPILASPNGELVTVQRKVRQVGDLTVNFSPTVTFFSDFLPNGNAVSLDDGGHGAAQLVAGDKANRLQIDYAIDWTNGKGPGPRPNPLTDLCNPCLILESPAFQGAIQFARKAIRDMVKDCRNRKGFKARRDFVEAFLKLVSADPCLLIEESPAQINLGFVRIGLFEACKVFAHFPIVAEAMKFVSDGLDLATSLLNKVPAEKVCDRVPQIDPGPAAKGSAIVTYATRFTSAANGLAPFGPPPIITKQDATGAKVTDPVVNNRAPVEGGANVNLAPQVIRDKTNESAQDLADVDVLLPAKPKPISFRCAREGFEGDNPGFFPFRVAKPVFEDEGSQVAAVHQFFHGLHPRTKASLHRGEGGIDVIGFASKTGSVEFNTTLSQNRAKHVSNELRIAAGSDSHLIVEGRGFLAAKLPGEEGRERRADVIAAGTLQGDDAIAVGSPEGCCVGGKIDDPVSPEAQTKAVTEAPAAPTPESSLDELTAGSGRAPTGAGSGATPDEADEFMRLLTQPAPEIEPESDAAPATAAPAGTGLGAAPVEELVGA
jgi:hypothetical protein